MTFGLDDSGQGGDPGAGRGGDPFDGGELPMSAGWVRGVGVVAIAVVVGVLLMPSATRAPLAVTTAKTTGGGSTSGTTSGTGTGSSTSAPRTTTTTGGVLAGASAIHVLVANGTSISHLAQGTQTYLHSRGFVTLTPTNSTTKVTATQIYAASGQQVAASLVVNALGLPANAVQPSSAVAPVASTGGATVVVIAGSDLARLAPTTSSTGTPG